MCDRDNADASRARHSQTPWVLKRCASCSLVYLENAPDYEALESDFAWERTFDAERAKRRRGRRLWYLASDALKQVKLILRGGDPRGKERRLMRRFVPQGRILDIGSGSGQTLRAVPADLTPYAIEISPVLAERSRAVCAPRGGSVVQNSALDGLGEFEADFFSGAIMRSFLEHEVHPRQLLEGLHRVMRPGGRVIIKVPNYDSLNRRIRGRQWCGFRYPDHVNYFTPSLLHRLVRDTGYRVARFGWRDHPPLSDNMWMIIEKPGPPGAG